MTRLATSSEAPPRRRTLRGFPTPTAIAAPTRRKVDVVEAAVGLLGTVQALSLQCRALAALASGADVVVLDLARVERLRPPALAILGRLSQSPRPVVLSGACPAVAREIRRASLHGMLDVFSTRDAALRTLAGG